MGAVIVLTHMYACTPVYCVDLSGKFLQYEDKSNASQNVIVCILCQCIVCAVKCSSVSAVLLQ
jgi:hypothetical protein